MFMLGLLLNLFAGVNGFVITQHVYTIKLTAGAAHRIVANDSPEPSPITETIASTSSAAIFTGRSSSLSCSISARMTAIPD